MFAAIISGLRPVELPFQIFFSGNLPGCQLLFAKLPFQQKLVQQVVAETDGYVFFREVRVCIFVCFIKPDARVSERKNRISERLEDVLEENRELRAIGADFERMKKAFGLVVTWG